MGTTTFTGPVRAGNILNTSGDIIGNNVANVGQVVMAQTFPLKETSAAITTAICIPAGSQIVSIQFLATTAFTNPVSIGIAANAATGGAANPTYFSAAAVVGPGLDPVSPNNALHWFATGTTFDAVPTPTNPYGSVTSSTDVLVTVNGGAAPGAGVGVLTVTYLQGPNGNA
jgi:hypothetical protein